MYKATVLYMLPLCHDMWLKEKQIYLRTCSLLRRSYIIQLTAIMWLGDADQFEVYISANVCEYENMDMTQTREGGGSREPL